MAICPVTPVIGAAAVVGAGAPARPPPTQGARLWRGQCGLGISNGRTYAAARQAQGESATERDVIISLADRNTNAHHTFTIKQNVLVNIYGCINYKH